MVRLEKGHLEADGTGIDEQKHVLRDKTCSQR